MKHIPVAIALVLVLLGFMPAGTKATGPVADAMSAATRQDKAKLRGIYTALADVTERDGGKAIATVGVWRDVHSATLRLAVGDMKGKYPGLDVAVEKVLAQHVSTDDVALKGDTLNAVVAGCREVAKQGE